MTKYKRLHQHAFEPGDTTTGAGKEVLNAILGEVISSFSDFDRPKYIRKPYRGSPIRMLHDLGFSLYSRKLAKTFRQAGGYLNGLTKSAQAIQNFLTDVAESPRLSIAYWDYSHRRNHLEDTFLAINCALPELAYKAVPGGPRFFQSPCLPWTATDIIDPQHPVFEFHSHLILCLELGWRKYLLDYELFEGIGTVLPIARFFLEKENNHLSFQYDSEYLDPEAALRLIQMDRFLIQHRGLPFQDFERRSYEQRIVSRNEWRQNDENSDFEGAAETHETP